MLKNYHVRLAYNENKKQFVEFDITGFKSTNDSFIYNIEDDITYLRNDRIYEILITKLNI